MSLRAGLLAAFLFAPASSQFAHANRVSVPAVVLKSPLQHYFSPPQVGKKSSAKDGVAIPGTGYFSTPFTAAFAPGDTLTIRIEAPPGMKLLLRHIAGAVDNRFVVDIHWVAVGGMTAPAGPHWFTFENLVGPVPTESSSFVTTGESGGAIVCEMSLDNVADISFTALQIEFIATGTFTSTAWSFPAVGSSTAPSIFGFARDVDSNPTVMQFIGFTTAVPTLIATPPFSLEVVGANPTRGTIGIEYALSSEARVRLGLFDLQGRQVVELRNRVESSGSHRVDWNPASQRVVPGVYFVRGQGAGLTVVRRVVVL